MKMTNLVDWAKEELARIGGQDDEMQQAMNRDILQIVETFSDQGHSGFSAGYALNIIKRLLNWKPILPLTGEDDEWGETYKGDEEKTQQNKRCSAVFRKNYDNSTAYYINGKVFSDDKGESWYTDRNSFVPVTFPYDVPEQPERIILD
jgi:hypothetical protein